MDNKLRTDMIMDMFAGGMVVYITNYFYSLRDGIYKPKVSYEIPNDEYISEHWRDILLELQSLKPICEYSDKLKIVAQQYLPIFLSDYPQYQDAECLKMEEKMI